MNEQPINLRQPMQWDEAIKIRKAFLRLRELSDSKIITKDSDAEKRLLTEYLNKSAVQHFNELMGCWFVVTREYQPLIDALIPLVGRAIQSMQQPAAAPEPASEEQPSNVIELPKS
jgi:hypothetical protein